MIGQMAIAIALLGFSDLGRSVAPLHCITSCKGFKLACVNVNSLFKHIDEIRYILINSPLEVLAINESKLDDTISDTEVYIPGYVIIRKDRSRSGGAVALYIRENLSYTNRIDLVPENLEMVCVEINPPHSRSFLVSTWYRPPSAEMQLFDEYEKFVQRCDIEDKQLILMGDINSDYAKTPLHVHTKTLQFISSVYQLKQLIKEPTRVTKSSATTLDFIFTNMVDKIATSGVIHLGISV